MSSLLAEVRLDEWLSSMLGRDTYSLTFDTAADFSAPGRSEEEELLRLLNVDPVLLFTKVPPTENRLIRFLEEKRFRLVDTNLLFHKPVVLYEGTRKDAVVRFAAPADEANAVSIARSSFIYSRFHLDSQIPKETADKIKAEWVGNYFRGQRGSRLVVAEEEGHVIGFMLVLCDEERRLITIDLIATEKAHRQRGIAAEMVRFAEGAMQHYKEITVGTQLANMPSIKLYERLGFTLQSASYVFHYHNRS